MKIIQKGIKTIIMNKNGLKNNEFDKIWEQIILELINQFQNEYTDYLLPNNLEKQKNKIKKLYTEFKNIFLNSYMSSVVANIDRHKIAACITKAILINKPLKINYKKFTSAIHNGIIAPNSIEKKQITFLNEYLALSVTITILDNYIEADNKKKNKHIILLPDPYPEKDNDYIKDVCLDLHFTSPNKINIVTLANVFFLWEKYSCRRAQCRNLKEAYREILLDTKICTLENVDDKIQEIILQPRTHDLISDINYSNTKTPISDNLKTSTQ